MVTRPSEANDASLSDFFIFYFLKNFFIFSLSSSLLPPRPSFLLVPPSSSSLLPLCPSFLLVPPSRTSFLLIQHCLNHLESVKVHFSSILTKVLPTDQRTDQRTDRQTSPLIEMQTHLKNVPREVKFAMGPEKYAVRLRFSIEPKPFRPNFAK